MILNGRERDVPWTVYGLVLSLGVLILLRLNYLFPRFSDGSIYLYLSYLVGDGLVPYRDFFYSSPPLIPYLFSWYGTLFGFSWQAFGYIPLGLSLIDAVIIYWLVLKNGSHLGALSGAVLYSLSFATLATSDFTSDVHLVLTLVLLGAAAGQKRWPVVSGVFFGLAVLAKLYAVVLLAGWVAGLGWDKRWREIIRFVIGSLLVVGIGAGLMWWWVGNVFYEQVILSHAGSVNGLSRKDIVVFFVRHDWALALAPVAWFLVRKKMPGWIVWPIVALLGWMMWWSDFYYLYLKVLAAWLALWWGWVIARLDLRMQRRAMVYMVVGGLIIISGLMIGRYVTEQAEAAVIAPLDEVVEYVREQTAEGEEIYGSFEITPLIALGAERKIWNNVIDTNIKFFQNGWFNMEQRAKEIKQDKVRAIITKVLMVKGGRIATGLEEVLPRTFFNDNCRLGKMWPVEKDYTHNAVAVWLCDYNDQ